MTTLGELSDWLEQLKKRVSNWQNAPLHFTLNDDKFWDPEVTLEDNDLRITLYDEFLTEGVEFELDYEDEDLEIEDEDDE